MIINKTGIEQPIFNFVDGTGTMAFKHRNCKELRDGLKLKGQPRGDEFVSLRGKDAKG